MADVHMIEQRRPEKLRGRDRRSLNLSTKLTAAESKRIEDAASQVSKTPSEWARDVLLRSANLGSYSEMEMHLFTELVGIQMLLMNAHEPLLRGEKMAQEQLAALYRRVQTTKAAQAQELLAKRGQNKER
jgi:hypothetical protein